MPGIHGSLQKRFASFAVRSHLGGILIVGLLALLFGICLWHVVEGTKPWETRWAERVAQGRTPGLLDYIRAGTWVAALVNAVVSAMLLVTARWWLRTRDPEPQPSPLLASPASLREGPSGRLFWFMLAGILLLALVPRLPRMNHSLWGDEEWAFRKHVHGVFVPVDANDPLGPLAFESPDWTHALFYNRDGNNHHLFTLVQRATMVGWHAATGAPQWAFSEPVTRVPSLITGLASIVAAALVLRRFGAPSAGLTLAALLALHPMHVRYSTEARGYALMLLLMVLWFVFAEAARARSRWRDWAGLAVVQFLAIYCWTAALYPIAVGNLVLLAAMFRGGGGRNESGTAPPRSPFSPTSDAGARVWRWFVCSSLAGAAFIQLHGPVFPQIRRAVEHSSAMKGQPMDLHWLRDSAARLLTGSFWDSTDPANPAQVTLHELLAARPLAYGILLAALLVLAALGFASSLRRSRWTALLAAAPILALAPHYLHFAKGLDVEMRYWYQIYAYPFFFAFVALGATRTGRSLNDGRTRWRRIAIAAPLAPALVVVAFGVATIPQHRSQARFPFEDFRTAARLTRLRHEPAGSVAPTKIRTLAAWRSAPLYDPRIDTSIRTGDAVRAEVAATRADGGRLYFTIGNYGFTKAHLPDLIEAAEDPSLFRHLVTLPSEDPMFSLHVFEMIPAPEHVSR